MNGWISFLQIKCRLVQKIDRSLMDLYRFAGFDLQVTERCQEGLPPGKATMGGIVGASPEPSKLISELLVGKA